MKLIDKVGPRQRNERLLLFMSENKEVLPVLSNLCFGFGYFLNDNLNTF